MTVLLTPTAADYIHERGGIIYFGASQKSSSCCISVNFGPSVRLGMPQNPERYVKHVIDDTIVYVPSGLRLQRPITVGLTSFLFFKSLEIEDWKLI